MQVQDQLLRMADLANTPSQPEKVIKDKLTGKSRVIQAKPAKRGLIGFSAKHIYHLIDCGKFPKPIKIGRASLWRLSDINAWFTAQGTEGESNVN